MDVDANCTKSVFLVRQFPPRPHLLRSFANLGDDWRGLSTAISSNGKSYGAMRRARSGDEEGIVDEEGNED